MRRRTFLSSTAAVAATAQALPKGTRTWIGPQYFANRYQDWRLHDGRIECLAAGAGDELRAVALLTREVRPGPSTATIKVRTGTIEDAGGGGFSGFLIGAGAGELDWRAAALVHRSSGTNGGILCVLESDGKLGFRDHTSEDKPLEFAPLSSRASGQLPARKPGEDIELKLDIAPQGTGKFKLTLSAGAASAVLENVAEKRILGGISLVSSPMPGKAGARYWFQDVSVTGTKIAEHSDRTFGPIFGTMFSLNGKVMKLTAQMAPIGDSDPRKVRLDYRVPGNPWRTGPEAVIDSAGYIARFRLDNWDSTKDWQYRVVYGDHVYDGHIPADPGAERPLRIAFYSCVMTAWRTIDSGVFKPTIPGERFLPRYTHDAIYFPHSEVIRNSVKHQPDLVAFLGDQIYEGNPTRKDQAENPWLDYLYKWSFWVWAFRDLTRHIPSIVLADDHDVYQGNVWGHGGRRAPNRVQEAGGYTCSPAFVNIVQNTQCSHNPDPHDPSPAGEGIGVYYGSFRYGGVEFALIEDRKFKHGPRDKSGAEPQMLGARQEAFLKEWAAKVKSSPARIAFSQTVFACVQTSPQGKPLSDSDSNGWPKAKRDTAVRLLKEAGALLLAGDQHLASVVRHDIDGPVQFAGPGGGTSFQRWFEPGVALPTDFTDGFGNRFRVLAVANPKVSFATYRKHKPPRGQALGDRSLKSEGYGIVIVDHAAKTYSLQCWPWNEDPARPGAKQFEGWPILVRFDEV
ncbi:MAG: alkaline phosphatase D family protein [Bryobacteraceae bacterium]|nr:alkaline phosphatase D family protein [Bryobacteraceae bacterium]